MRTSNDDTLLIRFLLGELPDAEAARIEAEFFSNSTLFHQICELEEHLIRDHLLGLLPPGRKERFEARLRLSPDLRLKTDAARTLMDEDSARPVERAPIPLPPPWLQLQQFTSTPLAAWLAIAAAAVLAVGVIWNVHENSALSAEIALLRAEARQGVRGPLTASFLLLPGITRGGSSGSERYRVSAATGVVRLTLAVSGLSGYHQYRAMLRTVDGQVEVWSGEAKTASGGVEVELPAASLTTEDYVVVLNGISSSGLSQPLDSYAFPVTRQ